MHLTKDAQGKTFALKVITCTEDAEIDDALAEADAYRRFDHPGIGKLLGQDTAPSKTRPGATEVLLLFPAYRQGTLQAKVDDMAAMSPAQHFDEHDALQLFLEICIAVNELSTAGLAHRDLKLGNVLLDDRGKPVLMDFGSVSTAVAEIESRKEALALEEQAAEKSTMPYRAPELFNVPSQCVMDGRTDVWSLGCMLYAMCYHVTPFEYIAGPTGSLALAIAQGKIKWPTKDPYSGELRSLISDLLTLDPSSRPDISALIGRVRGMA